MILDRFDKWRRKFRMTLGAKGDLFIEHQQGDLVSYGLVKFEKPERDENLRVTLSWDAPSRIGILTVENLDTGVIGQKVLEDPSPWPLADLHALTVDGDGVNLDPGITLMAICDGVAPVGLKGGFVAGTPIETSLGPRPVESLATGDLVQTSEHGMQPVRRVASFEVPAIGSFAVTPKHPVR